MSTSTRSRNRIPHSPDGLVSDSNFNEFLKLFPWRFDFLYADIPHPEQSPEWRSEDRYPLSDRAIEAGKKIFGVRFGAETQYLMFDIDKNSFYHPRRDPRATGRLLEAMEALGLTDSIIVSSSYSGGIHIYFPLPEKVLTWQLAGVVERWVKQRGFFIEKGTLEIFPNYHPFSEENRPLYNGHRLPLQSGSYLLDGFWNPITTHHLMFVKHWRFCQARNEINAPLWNRLLKEVYEEARLKRISRPAAKFLEDLNNAIEPGWTGPGQTNWLLGRIALRSYVFGHVIDRLKPLTGDRLICHIVSTATRLPGYSDYCRHQKDIWTRAEQWARCVESCRRYYPYGRKELSTPPPAEEQPARSPNSWNQQQQLDARERLELSIAVMMHNDTLPVGIRERFEVLTQEFHFSGETLYKHCDLWHPAGSLWKTPPAPPNGERLSGEGSFGQPSPEKTGNLLNQSGCNAQPAVDWGGFLALLEAQTGRNTISSNGLSNFSPQNPVDNSPHYPHGGGNRRESDNGPP